jgi:hypothetical protein
MIVYFNALITDDPTKAGPMPPTPGQTTASSGVLQQRPHTGAPLLPEPFCRPAFLQSSIFNIEINIKYENRNLETKRT